MRPGEDQGELALAPREASPTGEAFVPRPYQAECVNAVVRWWAERPSEHPVVVLPTASGKTIIFSLLIKWVLDNWTDVRVLILAHTQELIEQSEQKLLTVWPEAPVGIYCAGLGRRELKQVTVASRDSIVGILDSLLPDGGFDLVIVDEVHRVGRSESSRYRTILTSLSGVGRQMAVVGFSATPYRTDSGFVYGEDQFFSGVAYERSVREMIRDGYLCEPRAVAVEGQISAAGIKTRMGDFNQRQLGERAAQQDLVDRQLDEWETHARGRQSTVFFCVNVAHAEMISERLLHRDYCVPTVTAMTPKDERAAVLQQFLSGEIPGIANVGVLTEGWDCPRLDCVAVMRPTKSLGLFIQMVGRGLRPSPDTGKNDCLLLDFGGNLARFGPIDRARPARGRREDAPSRVKTCPCCELLCPLAAKECPHCGEPFGVASVECERCGAENRPGAAQCEACGHLLMPKDMQATASSRSVLSDQRTRERDVQCFEVDDVTVSAHTSNKSGGRYLRIYYRCGLEQYDEILCLGYDGWPGKKAERRLRQLLREDCADMPECDPDTFIEWHGQVAGGLLKPVRAIYVDLASEWRDVTYTEFWTEAKLAAVLDMERGNG